MDNNIFLPQSIAKGVIVLLVLHQKVHPDMVIKAFSSYLLVCPEIHLMLMTIKDLRNIKDAIGEQVLFCTTSNWNYIFSNPTIFASVLLHWIIAGPPFIQFVWTFWTLPRLLRSRTRLQHSFFRITCVRSKLHHSCRIMFILHFLPRMQHFKMTFLIGLLFWEAYIND